MATCLVYNQEDWMHFDADSLAEGLYLFGQSYMHWNPRLGEMLMYVHGGAMDNPLPLFQLINPVCVCLLVHFCFRLGVGRWAGGKQGDVLGLLFCMFSVLAFHAGLYWYNGNMSWLYPCTVAAGFLIAVERIFFGDFQFSVARTFWILPLAVVTGMSNNNTPVVILPLVGGAWLYTMLKQKRWFWPSPGYILLASVLVAAFLCYFFAPGNAARMEISDWELSFSCWWNRSMLVAENWIYHCICQWRPMLSLALVLGIMWKTGHLGLLKERRFMLLVASYAVLWALSTLAPCWGQPRAYVPMDMAMASLLGGLVCALLAANIRRFWIVAALGGHMLISLTMVIPESCKVFEQGRVLDEIRARACAASANGQRELVLEVSGITRELVIPGMSWCPKSVFRHTQTTWKCIRTCKRSDFEAGRIHHTWGELPYTPKGDSYIGEAGNAWLARPCGLESIYCLED